MIRRCVPVLMTCLAVSGATTPAAGQLGPLLDWIHEMSGPKFIQWGATFSLGYQPGLELDLRPFQHLAAQAPGLRTSIEMTQEKQVLADALVNRTVELLNAVAPYAGSVRYRAVLVDGFTAEVRRLSDDISKAIVTGAELTPNALQQLDFRAERLLQTLQQFDPIDALDRGNGIRGRLAITGGSSALSDNTKDPDTAAVNIISITPTAEYLFSRWFAFETGVGVHYFFGDIEPFWSVSMPLLLVARPLVTNRSRFLRSFRINFGANIFAPLGEDAFEPVATIPGTSFEWVWTGFLSLDFPIGR